MAYRPVISVVDLTTGDDYTTSTVTVELRPYGSSTGKINCTRLSTSHRYYADSNVDESKLYDVMVNYGSGFVKRGVVPVRNFQEF